MRGERRGPGMSGKKNQGEGPRGGGGRGYTGGGRSGGVVEEEQRVSYVLTTIISSVYIVAQVRPD